MSTQKKVKAREVIDDIEQQAKEANDDLRMARVVEPGQWLRQGDITVVRVDHAPHVQASEKAHPSQLAPGNTKGSRHVLKGAAAFFIDVEEFFESEFADSMAKVMGLERTRELEPLIGPLIKAPKRFTITHPEHSDLSLPGGCEYLVLYQRDYEQEEISRVAD
jgi:hypothetical protein